MKDKQKPIEETSTDKEVDEKQAVPSESEETIDSNEEETIEELEEITDVKETSDETKDSPNVTIWGIFNAVLAYNGEDIIDWSKGSEQIRGFKALLDNGKNRDYYLNAKISETKKASILKIFDANMAKLEEFKKKSLTLTHETSSVKIFKMLKDKGIIDETLYKEFVKTIQDQDGTWLRSKFYLPKRKERKVKAKDTSNEELASV